MAAQVIAGSASLPERRFYVGMAIAMLAAVVVGFSRSVFLRPLFPEWHSPAEPIFYVHGAAFFAWILLVIVQTTLVANGRTDLHRKVGRFGITLALAMVVRISLADALSSTTSTRTPRNSSSWNI